MASFGRAFQLAKHVLLRSLSLTARTTRTQLLRCYHTPPAALHQKLLPVIVPLHSSSRVHVRRVFSSSRRQPALQLHCASIQPSMSALHIPLYTNFKRTFHVSKRCFGLVLLCVFFFVCAIVLLVKCSEFSFFICVFPLHNFHSFSLSLSLSHSLSLAFLDACFVGLKHSKLRQVKHNYNQV